MRLDKAAPGIRETFNLDINNAFVFADSVIRALDKDVKSKTDSKEKFLDWIETQVKVRLQQNFFCLQHI